MRRSTGGLAIPGSIITTVGLILLVQEMTGWWQTWSYAWALIVAAVGAGMVINGYWSDQPDLRKNGWETVRTGLTLFLVFGAIMEFIFTVTGVSEPGSLAIWSVLLIVVAIGHLAMKIDRLVAIKDDLKKDDRDLFGPFFLAAIGLTALFYSLGLVTGTELLTLLSLWPLLLIFAGLQLIFGRRSPWLSALLGILLVAVVCKRV